MSRNQILLKAIRQIAALRCLKQEEKNCDCPSCLANEALTGFIAKVDSQKPKDPPPPRIDRKAVFGARSEPIISMSFDGGCIGNPGNKYGSHESFLGDTRLCRESRLKFGHGTNNEAEFNALSAGITTLLLVMSAKGMNPAHYRLKISTDSMIMLNRMMGKNTINKKPAYAESSTRMFNLAEDCLNQLNPFAAFVVEWNRRDANVERFGH